MNAKPQWVSSLSLVRRVNETALAYTLSRMKVCGGADYLWASHRNMERLGMWLLFQRAAWTPRISSTEMATATQELKL